MTPIDVNWFRMCYSAGLVKGPFLEVESARIQGDPNLCDLAQKLGVDETIGADLQKCAGVDFACDFGLPKSEFQKQCNLGKFSTVCVFNVLEHTFDPIAVLSNALSCVADHGSLLVVTPAIWPIHNYPGDYNRLLPDWYKAFAMRQGVDLLDEQFCWLSQFGIEPVSSKEEFPTFISRRSKISIVKYSVSRITHKLLTHTVAVIGRRIVQ
jgi:SAM-dependent methyltransferase